MIVLQMVALALVVAGAVATVLTREPRRQAIVFGAYGFLLALLFLVLEAPDVALSQVAVSGLIIPLLVLFALAKLRGTDEP